MIDAKTPHFIIQCNLKFIGSVQIAYSVGKRGTLRNQCVYLDISTSKWRLFCCLSLLVRLSHLLQPRAKSKEVMIYTLKILAFRSCSFIHDPPHHMSWTALLFSSNHWYKFLSNHGIQMSIGAEKGSFFDLVVPPSQDIDDWQAITPFPCSSRMTCQNAQLLSEGAWSLDIKVRCKTLIYLVRWHDYSSFCAWSDAELNTPLSSAPPQTTCW